ncbi:MAG: hypothetical protein KAS21_01175 [Candidatus Aminicenantes bacterium]|nr:hypothetical protein [Candidatus Aminicenantes bacterium]MCK5003668.1 hypothetical protein [Candidatus Aminicenantes bacterium]
MRFIFIFIDGVGIGKSNGNNPFIAANPKILRLWDNSAVDLPNFTLKPIDPLLGIDGTPQSATGQTTIFTGVNIPKLLSKHIGSFPNKIMRKVISEENLLVKLNNSGKKAKFINAYPHHSELFSNSNVNIDKEGNLIFSDNFPDKFKKRISVTSSILISNNVKPFDTGDIKEKLSLYQDYSNKSLLKYGLDLPVFSPEDAAEVLYRTSGDFDLILYEFFQSDIYGHRKNIAEQIELISDLDLLLSTLISLMDRKKDTLLITSDHGNLEDNSSKAHTLNPVPLITWGRKNNELSENINDLSGITPAILNFLNS